MRVKVCGIRERSDLAFLSNSSVDFVGFIFYDKSPRFFLSGTLGKEDLSSFTKPKVGVFVNEKISTVESIASTYHIDLIQLHGDESPDYCLSMKEKGYTLIKAFSIEDQLPESLEKYISVVDFFLFDTKGKNYGGNGKGFNWSVLKEYHLDTPYISSGGIGPEDVQKILALNEPKLYAIDVNSCFEIHPGKKDEHQIKNFVEQLKN